jgi:hypothetical protein
MSRPLTEAAIRAASDEAVRVAAELSAKGYTAQQAAEIAFLKGYRRAVEVCTADLNGTQQ